MDVEQGGGCASTLTQTHRKSSVICRTRMNPLLLPFVLSTCNPTLSRGSHSSEERGKQA